MLLRCFLGASPAQAEQMKGEMVCGRSRSCKLRSACELPDPPYPSCHPRAESVLHQSPKQVAQRILLLTTHVSLLQVTASQEMVLTGPRKAITR